MRRKMMILIDREALCQDLLDRWSVADEKEEGEIQNVMADVVTPIVFSQPTIEMPSWIPCSERLPDACGKYLVTNKWRDNSGGEHIAVMTSWYKKFGVIGLDWQDFGVLAWQPLPTPYREEIDE
jgi:hypothetical protein